MLENFALDKHERWKIILSADIALDAIITLCFGSGYSIHAEKEGNGIKVIIKNKEKRSLHISKEARELMEQYL
jgi:hypothetical protein